MSIVVEFISLNHYIIPYLIKDITISGISTLLNGLLWSVLSINIEPPYHAFAHPYIVVPHLFHDKSSNFEMKISPIHFI
jgi:hypothetical protein